MKPPVAKLFLFGISLSISVAVIVVQPPDYIRQLLMLFFSLLFLVAIYGYIVKGLEKAWQIDYSNLLIFSSFMFVQELVLSTGGINSPFASFIYFYAAAFTLFSDVLGAVIVLLIFYALIGLQHYLDFSFMHEILSDPSQYIVFPALMLFYIPAFHYLLTKFEIRASLFSGLQKRFQQHVQSSIVNLNDLVIVTNGELKIISLNQDAQTAFQMRIHELLFKPLLSILHLEKPGTGKILSEYDLGLNQVRETRAPTTMTNIKLIPNRHEKGINVSLLINPIIDVHNNLQQIVFTIKQIKGDESESVSAKLNLILNQRWELQQNLRRELLKNADPGLAHDLERLYEVEYDMLTMLEIEKSIPAESFEFVDIINTMQSAIQNEIHFADSFRVMMKLNRIDENVSRYQLNTIGGVRLESQYSEASTALTQTRWLKLLFKKLLDISILLSSTPENETAVNIEFSLQPDNIDVTIISSFRALQDQEKEDIFKKGFGILSTVSGLEKGSGLEGYLAKRLADHLGYELGTFNLKEPQNCAFVLRIWRNPR